MEHNQLDRDELIEQNLPLVGYQVAELLRRVPSFVQREDLASAGALALVQAASSYDVSQGVPFHRYAVYRIRGAMLDELRSMDWATRGARQRAKQLEEMTQVLTQASGRAPTKEELAAALGVEVEKVENAQADAARRVVSIDGNGSDDEDAGRQLELEDDALSPEERLLTDEKMLYLRASVRALPQKLRFVIEQAFFEERPIQEIAEELGVTQSRVSQLRTEALALMRDGMNRHLDPENEEVDADVSNIVRKRRESYFEKIENNAQELMLDSSEEYVSLALPPPGKRGVKSQVRKADVESKVSGDVLGGLNSEPVSAVTRKPAGVSGNTASASSFLAGRSKSSAQSRAYLRAEELRQMEAEGKSLKGADKASGKAREVNASSELSEEKQPAPPTTSYLGGLALKKASRSASVRKSVK